MPGDMVRIGKKAPAAPAKDRGKKRERSDVQYLGRNGTITRFGQKGTGENVPGRGHYG